VVVDIGTGDGRYVYRSARQNPDRFYIGIDVERRALEKVSERIHRRPGKGGLPNVLFVHAPSRISPPSSTAWPMRSTSTSWPHLETSWAKRLRHNDRRRLMFLIAQAVGSPAMRSDASDE